MLDILLERARREGCACYKILDTPCLVHYAWNKQQNEEAYTALKKKLETKDAQSDRSAPPADSQRRSGRPAEVDFRADRRGNKDRPAKPVRKGSRGKR